MKTNQMIRAWSCLLLLALFVGCGGSDDEEAKPQPKLEAVAVATPAEVEVGETVQLDGASSKDPNQIGYTSLWTVTTKPNASTATIQNASAATASFTPDLAGNYVLTLTISNADKKVSHSADVSIVATPRLRVLSGRITEDMVLENVNPDPERPDYLVTEMIQVGAKLTIMPGVVIYFETDAGFHFNETGTIIANGTEAEKIIFTSETKEPGQWSGLKIRSTASNNSISNAEIHYAGSLKAGTFLEKAALSPEYTIIRLENILITNSGQYGIQTRENVSVINMSNITFRDNLGSAMYIHPEQMQYIDEDSDFNEGYVEVWGGSTNTSGGELHWARPKNGKYLITEDLTIARRVHIAAGAEFEVRDGVLINVGSFENAALIAKGDAENPIIFTSRTKEAGAWRGILVTSTSASNLLEHVRIENGGSSNQATFIAPANLGVSGFAKMKLNNVHIANSAGHGIVVKSSNNAQLTMTDVTYENNALDDLVEE